MQSLSDSGILCVLLVDDDPAVRGMLQMYLQRNGMRVLAASSGEEALAIFSSEHLTIDILVSDVVMSGISGRELAFRVRELQPSLPILLMSGYEIHVPDSPDEIPCMQKPLKLKRLVEEITALTRTDSESAQGESTGSRSAPDLPQFQAGEMPHYRL
jgi:DNA-binding response OmpR family regulator